MARANPRIGKPQPTLFGKDEPVFVPLKSLSDDEIVDLPRDAFSDDEFAELEEEQQAAIHENDPDSKARIENMANFFIDNIEWAGDDDRLTSEAEEYFDSAMAGYGEHDLWGRINHADPEDVVSGFVNAGHSEDEVTAALDKALSELENLDAEIRGAGWSACASDSLYVYAGDDESVSIDRYISDEAGIFDGIHDDEIFAAVEAIAFKFGYSPVSYDEIVELRDSRWGQITIYVDTNKVVCFEPNWGRISDALEEELGDAPMGDVEESPPEERVLPLDLEGGFYVQELAPSELQAESRSQGMCVGDPKYGYGRKVARGITKILSLRTPSGRPKLTFEVDTERDGTPTRVVQIKGKANRLPSKPQEVRNAIAVVEHLGLEPERVADLRPALGRRAYTRNPRRWHCGFCRKP